MMLTMLSSSRATSRRTVMLRGLGAGGASTASAVVSDVVNAVRDRGAPRGWAPSQRLQSARCSATRMSRSPATCGSAWHESPRRARWCCRRSRTAASRSMRRSTLHRLGAHRAHRRRRRVRCTTARWRRSTRLTAVDEIVVRPRPGRGLGGAMTTRAQGVIARWGDRLALPPTAPHISLGEGDTPCVESLTIGPSLGPGVAAFQARGPESHRLVQGPRHGGGGRGGAARGEPRDHLRVDRQHERIGSCVRRAASACATVVVVPGGRIASGKLRPGASARRDCRQHQTPASTSRCASCASSASSHPVTLVNSVNPNRIEGQKTAAFEIVDELGDAPDVLALPVGNAGNITAYWRGFREDFATGAPLACRECSAARPRARRRSCSDGRSTTRRPWRRRSASATRRPGRARSKRAISPRG